MKIASQSACGCVIPLTSDFFFNWKNHNPSYREGGSPLHDYALLYNFCHASLLMGRPTHPDEYDAFRELEKNSYRVQKEAHYLHLEDSIGTPRW